MNNDYLGLWLQFRCWLFGSVSISWSLSDEFGHAAILFPSSPGEAGLEDVPFLICIIYMVATSSHGYVKSPEGKFSKEKHFFF